MNCPVANPGSQRLRPLPDGRGWRLQAVRRPRRQRRSSSVVIQRGAVLMLALVILVVLSGCKKKRPQLPRQAQAPTITEPLPQSIPEVTEAPPEAEAPPTAPPEETVPKPKPKPRRGRGSKPVEKPAPPPPPVQQPPRTVIQEGGSTPPSQGGELTASISHDSAQHQRMNTAQLLEATEFNLKSVTRALNADEQAVVSHIRSFEQQSRAATAEGDLERAYNLALKAHLLSDELIKR